MALFIIFIAMFGLKKTLGFSTIFFMLILIFGYVSASAFNVPLQFGVTYDARINGSTADAQLRFPNSSNYKFDVGDLNGDGIDDLILTEPLADTNSKTNNGSVYIIFGSASGLSGDLSLSSGANYNLRIDGANSSDFIGRNDDSSLIIGDVNSDGVDDLIISSIYSDIGGTDGGAIWIIYSTLLDDYSATTGNIIDLANPSSYNLRYEGPSGARITFGASVFVEDFNSNGQNDLLIGASLYNQGWLWVIYDSLISSYGVTTGNNIPLSVSSNYNILYEGPDDDFGILGAIAVGDINGNGLNDFVASSRAGAAAAAGSVVVVFDTLISGVSGTGNYIDLAITSNRNARIYGGTGGRLSYSGVLEIGDVNQDGNGDLLIGTDHNASRLYGVLSQQFQNLGNTTGNSLGISTFNSFHITGTSQDDISLYHSIFVEDVNNDGHDDIVIGGESVYDYIFLSDTIAGIGNTTNNALSISDYSIRFVGLGVGAIGAEGSIRVEDADGDGLTDIILGTALSDIGGTNTGSLFIISSDELSRYQGTGNDIYLNSDGYSVRYDGELANDAITQYRNFAFGNFNGVGGIDVAIGSSYADHNGVNSGSIYVIYRDGAVVTNLDPALSIATSGSSQDLRNIPQFGRVTSKLMKSGLVISQTSIDFSDDINKDWSNVSADISLAQKKSVVSGLVTAPGTSSTHTLFIPKDTDDTSVLICPDADTLGQVGLGCSNGVTFSNGETLDVNGSSVTVSTTNINGVDYWVASGVNGTGGLSLGASDGYNGMLNSTSFSITPNVGSISSTQEVIISYIPSQEFINAQRIAIDFDTGGDFVLANCATATNDADGDGSIDGIGSESTNGGPNLDRYTYIFNSTGTSQATTNGINICVSVSSPSLASNYQVDLVDSFGSYSSGFYYVGSENQVNIVGTVDPVLTMVIRNSDDTADLENIGGGSLGPNLCDLGNLSDAGVQQCGYRIKVGTNASTGYTINISTDGSLRKGTDFISNIANSTSILSGIEGYGITLEGGSYDQDGIDTSYSPTTCIEQGDFSTDDTPLALDISTGIDLPLVSCGGPNNPNIIDTTNTALVVHRAEASAATPAGTYTHLVTYTVSASF